MRTFAWVALAAACGGEPPPAGAVGAAPAGDLAGAACADVGESRVCWSGAGAALRRTIVTPRPLPSWPVPESGWRCSGAGAARECEPRSRNAGAWDCDAATAGARACRQVHPRLPDDGEWECAELDGAVLCRGGGAPAGVVVGPADPGFACGPRRGHPEDRMCLDLSPDRPEGAFRGWRCRFDHDRGEKRLCTQVGDAWPPIDRPCREPRDCAIASRGGLVCERGRCVPEHPPAPECWLDQDCGDGKQCTLGSCR